MGKMENESRKERRRANIQKVVLQTVTAVGFLSLALLAPNALQMLRVFDPKLKMLRRKVIDTSRRRMVLNGLLQYKDGFLRLTPKGEEKLRQLEIRDYKIPRPKRWDKKWRLLIFDIPEKRKRVREKVRQTLVSLEFKRLQDSVWVYPYDCEDVITLLKADFKIGKDLLYIIVDKIENDKYLKNDFGIN
ncbi:MAG: CRISPR-associated endonuclease Cas2 [Candidatus Taylorbacteria bacterium RIFCSPHIGHO2_01_FULL_45_63]|uniref:CRISPR-associated endonuclease Cas2 n=1 Tax=Candidatus Taylorbacteria bacterium RIFCSPHIGHO2_02_FULL_45_35 TaxID=1802311 RepID=A0A1G2MTZ7_9BACT|nr:MAG: CRISPR-associated endonuclease Cas2 [Candidatus Taylorbacteria bacterium RIFCSPHIGHO2_01_FULL_45_63]OHA27346.1 MAG: CRISPR-associated endonuclease Cas2 [Candidatus Taylorbacteria bacterium RIFCSPHIGHO2_02_FULL_45_35]